MGAPILACRLISTFLILSVWTLEADLHLNGGNHQVSMRKFGKSILGGDAPELDAGCVTFRRSFATDSVQHPARGVRWFDGGGNNEVGR